MFLCDQNTCIIIPIIRERLYKVDTEDIMQEEVHDSFDIEGHIHALKIH